MKALLCLAVASLLLAVTMGSPFPLHAGEGLYRSDGDVEKKLDRALCEDVPPGKYVCKPNKDPKLKGVFVFCPYDRHTFREEECPNGSTFDNGVQGCVMDILTDCDSALPPRTELQVENQWH